MAGHGQLIGESALSITAITVALGIAGQQLIGSLLSGLFLAAAADCNVGDWLEWPDSEGTVEVVDLRVTPVLRPDNESVAVPNTEGTATAITLPAGGNQIGSPTISLWGLAGTPNAP